MKRKTIVFPLIFFFITSLVLQVMAPGQAWAQGPYLTARSAILMDPVTNRIIYSKTPYTQRAPASTTKLMTALVVLDNFNPEQTIMIPRSVTQIQPKRVGVRPGERFYVKDLLKLMLITSGNDIAHTFAVAVAGSEWRFARTMNAKARTLGAKNTQFANPHGLPKPTNQYSTAYDLALIVKAARRNPVIANIITQRYVSVTSLNGRRYSGQSTNKMLWRTPGRVQGKTGYTRRAMYCFAGKVTTSDNRELLISIMGSTRLWNDLTALVNYVSYGKSSGGKNPITINRRILSRKQIARLQNGLNHAGFKVGKADGVFGPKTLQAVKSFQKAKGLDPDGIVGSRTWAKLKPHLK